MRQLQSLSAEAAAASAVRQLVAAWNSDCADQRRARLSQVWHPAGWYADGSCVLCGVAALERHIEVARWAADGGRFEIEGLQARGAEVQFGWRWRAGGAGTPPLMSGRCHARLGPDGRFTSLVSALEAAGINSEEGGPDAGKLGGASGT